jgi:hypothetical protein
LDLLACQKDTSSFQLGTPGNFYQYFAIFSIDFFMILALFLVGENAGIMMNQELMFYTRQKFQSYQTMNARTFIMITRLQKICFVQATREDVSTPVQVLSYFKMN